MKHSVFRYRWPMVTALVLVALLTAAGIVLAQPPVPHATVEGDDCLGCHQSGSSGAPRLAWDHLGRGNTDCARCHAVLGTTASRIPHSLDGREECLACHSAGIGTAPRLTGSHVDYTVEQCAQCHPYPLVEPEPTPTPSPEPPDEEEHPPASTADCADCHQLIFADDEHAVFTGQPLDDPAAGETLFGQLCVSCHGEDGTTPVGDDEIVINDPVYLASHDDSDLLRGIGIGSHGAMTAFAQVYGGPLSWDEILDLAAFVRSWGPVETPASIPHTLEGRDDCLLCHSEEGVRPFPDNHAGRTSEECLLCHQPASSSDMTPTIPHDLEGRDDCLLCHSEEGVRPFPDNHVGRTSEECLLCHQPASSSDSTPTIPHDLEGRDDCLLCHAEGGFVPVPADHEGRTSDDCLMCHEPASISSTLQDHAGRVKAKRKSISSFNGRVL